jgi:hypothetical protein
VDDGLIDRAETLDDDGAEDALLADGALGEDGALVDTEVAAVVAVVAAVEATDLATDVVAARGDGAVPVAVEVVDLPGDLPDGAPDVDEVELP